MTENDDAVSSPEPEPRPSWTERYGALLVGGGLALVLILMLILDRLVRGPR
jgi:hypothetical protein